MAKTKVGKRANKNYLIPLRPLEPTVLNRLPRCRNGESGPKVLGPVRSRRLSFIPNFPTPAEGLGVAPGSQLLIPEIFHDILEVLRTFFGHPGHLLEKYECRIDVHHIFWIRMFV